MKQKVTTEEQKNRTSHKQEERVSGCVFLCVGMLLLFNCLFHQKNDTVQYPWGTSPYLFPVILSGVLALLGVYLLARAGMRAAMKGETKAANLRIRRKEEDRT